MILPEMNSECESVLLSLLDDDKCSEWIDNSSKSDPPPDFYNNKTKVMMEVMRVDDHGHEVTKGKYINPVNQRESQIQKELRQKGFLDTFSNVKSVFVNAVTDWPEKEDHCYQFYVDNFKKTLEKHIKSIPLYRKNHPGFKLVFFIFDESSGYVVAENKEQTEKRIKPGDMFYCYPYINFVDERFVRVFEKKILII